MLLLIYLYVGYAISFFFSDIFGTFYKKIVNANKSIESIRKHLQAYQIQNPSWGTWRGLKKLLEINCELSYRELNLHLC